MGRHAPHLLLHHPLSFLLTAFATSTLVSSAGLSALERPREGFFETVLEGGADQRSCKPTGQIQDACCDFETVEEVNLALHTQLAAAVQLPIFRYHKVDLYRECPFWVDSDGACGNRACAVSELDEDHIPEYWRSDALGKLKTAATGEIPISMEDKCDVKQEDFCVLEDDTALSQGVYVDLLSNPERFTGYAGPSASKIWKSIYEENCFNLVPYLDTSSSSFATSKGSETMVSKVQMGLLGMSPGKKGELGKLTGSVAGPRDGGEETCLEKRVYYRLLSGLHASISIHICDEYLDQQTGLWVPNLQCFITRIAQHPERLQNVYFNYVLLLRALSKAGPYLLSSPHILSTNNPQIDAQTTTRLRNLISAADSCPGTFDERSMFGGVGAGVLKEEFKEHFRNVSRIMDCVGCDKCRLWGKLQVTGLGTALKLLFEFEDGDAGAPPTPQLTRSELIAFINTLHRFSESLTAIDKFRKLWAQRSTDGTLPPLTSEEKEDAGKSGEAAEKVDVRAGLGPRVTSRWDVGGVGKGEETGSASGEAVSPPPPPVVVATATKETPIAIAEKDKAATPKASSVSASASPLGGKQPQTHTANGQTETLAKLLDKCRSSWIACFQWLEKVLSLLGLGTGGVGESKDSSGKRGTEL